MSLDEQQQLPPQLRNLEQGKTALLAELVRLLRHVDWTEQAQAIRARGWRTGATFLALASAIVGGFAGASSLGNVFPDKRVAAWVALVAAALAATSAALGSDRRAASAASSQKDFAALRDQLVQSATLDIPALEPNAMRTRIDELTNKMHAAERIADLPGRSLGWRERVRWLGVVKDRRAAGNWWWSETLGVERRSC
jgi:hypothetical protein